MIDWANFTPYQAIIGGILIGLAATIFILFNGRIAGISGILGGLLKPTKSEFGWRLAFLLGLILAPSVYLFYAPLPQISIDTSVPWLIAAGALVGFGARLGSGCTSGHGVCGLSRLSLRSLVATMTFMGAGFFIVYLSRHLLG